MLQVCVKATDEHSINIVVNDCVDAEAAVGVRGFAYGAARNGLDRSARSGGKIQAFVEGGAAVTGRFSRTEWVAHRRISGNRPEHGRQLPVHQLRAVCGEFLVGCCRISGTYECRVDGVSGDQALRKLRGHVGWLHRRRDRQQEGQRGKYADRGFRREASVGPAVATLRSPGMSRHRRLRNAWRAVAWSAAPPVRSGALRLAAGPTGEEWGGRT